MSWIFFVVGAVLSWGSYGVILHIGQTQLGSPLKALLCVGGAYFLIGFLLPLGLLASQGQLSGFRTTGVVNATIAGVLGAAGAVCIIWAFKNGGLPMYVMPLVFAGTPIVNVATTMLLHPPKSPLHPMLWVGLLLASAGAGMVLYFKPAS